MRDERGVFTLYLIGVVTIFATVLAWWLVTPLLDWTHEATAAVSPENGVFEDSGVSGFLEGIWKWLPVLIVLGVAGWMFVMAHRDIYGVRGG